MLNSVNLIGFLMSNTLNPNQRVIKVRRTYKNNEGKFEEDIIPLINWTKDYKNTLNSFKDGTLVSIKGRIEVIENSVMVVVENISYIRSA